MISGYQLIGSSTSAGSFRNVLILDSLGNYLKQTTFNNYDGGGFMGLIQLKDKNFLTCGAYNMNSDFGIYTRYKPFVAKFDTNGNKIWSQVYDTIFPFTYISFLYELPSGDIMMGGHLNTAIKYGLSGPVRMRIYRISPKGDLIWKKFVGMAYDDLSSEYIRSMNPTSDGGFILAGWNIFAYSPRPYNIVKIDSTGCDSTEAYCRSRDSLILLGLKRPHSDNAIQFYVYPNPASDLVQIRVDAPEGEDLLLEVSDITGRKVGSYNIHSRGDLQINTGKYQNGVYFITLYSGGNAVGVRKLLIRH